MSPVRWKRLAVSLVPLAVIAASTMAPSAASTIGHAAAPTWVWSKVVAMPGKAATYGIGGLSCASNSLCVSDVLQSDNNKTGIYETTDPAAGGSKWHFVAFSEPFTGGDTGDDVSCEPAGVHDDCAMVGFAPLPGHPNESYGGSIFQSGTPTKPNWGAALTDTTAQFGAVSCWANVNCASIDDDSDVVTTAGATVTSQSVPLWPADEGFSGIWAIGCAPFTAGQPNPFCAAVDQNASHSIAWTTDPTSGKWRVEPVGVPRGLQLWHVACASAGVCVVAENNDIGSGFARIGVSHGDTFGLSWVTSFKQFDLFPKNSTAGVSAVTCNSAKMCAAGGASSTEGFVSLSTNPSVPGTWHTYALKKGWEPVAMSCPSLKLCVLVSSNGGVVVGTLK
jgi:hypothetical protein